MNYINRLTLTKRSMFVYLTANVLNSNDCIFVLDENVYIFIIQINENPVLNFSKYACLIILPSGRMGWVFNNDPAHVFDLN